MTDNTKSLERLTRETIRALEWRTRKIRWCRHFYDHPFQVYFLGAVILWSFWVAVEAILQ